MIFAHTCDKCGQTCEPHLIEVSQVLVVSCGNCLQRIRYGHRNEYPDLQAIKSAIYDLCERKPAVVHCIFNGQQHPRQTYWRVYRELIHKVQKTFGT